MARRRLAGTLLTLVLLALTAGLVVRRLLDAHAVRAALERQAREAIGQPVRIGTVDWTLWSARPRVVLLDVRVGEPATMVVQQVELSARLRALLSRRIEQASLVITGSRITLPLALPPGGAAPAWASGARPPPDLAATAALTIASIDRIALRDVELVVGPQRLTPDMESSLKGGRLAISRLQLGSQRSIIEGEGELAPLDPLRGHLTLAARRLDLDELLTIASGLVASRGHAATPAGAPSSAAGHGSKEVEGGYR